MTSEELRIIITNCGGIEQLATLIRVTPRRITSWLYEERTIPPSMALLITLVTARVN